MARDDFDEARADGYEHGFAAGVKIGRRADG